MARRNIIIAVTSIIGIIVFFGICALVARFVNTNDIALGKELPLGEPVYLSIDDTVKAQVIVNSARELTESEAIGYQVSAKGKTLVAVDLSVDILDSTYRWGANCMRVRDSKGKYGDVVMFRNGVAICRIDNPSDQISFFIYTGDWTTHSSLKSTGRYKLPVAEAAADPMVQTRRGLEENRLDLQGLTMELEEGFTYWGHMVQENWVYLEYEDMIVDISVHEYTDIDMDTETLIRQNRVIGNNDYEMIAEPAQAGLADDRWHHMMYETDGLAYSAYFFVQDNVSYAVKFFTEGTASDLDQARITAMMQTAVIGF